MVPTIYNYGAVQVTDTDTSSDSTLSVNFQSMTSYINSLNIAAGTAYVGGGSPQALVGSDALVKLNPGGTWATMFSSNMSTDVNQLTSLSDTSIYSRVTFTGSITQDSPSVNTITLGIYKDGILVSGLFYVDAAIGVNTLIMGQWDIPMSLDDYVEVYVGFSQSANLTVNTFTLTSQYLGIND